MCGIVGYVGNKAASTVLFEGLRSLEYRGYDSAGIAVLNASGELSLAKTSAKISHLEALISELVACRKTGLSLAVQEEDLVQGSIEDLQTASCGIGHTRWATHGEANVNNAHPHSDPSASLALVHNGIIKNYLELKTELEEQGVKFKTDTDSEVIAALFASYRVETSDDRQALLKTIHRLEGSYAIAVIMKSQASKNLSDRKILVAKNESPLIIGLGESENYIASDSSTVLQFTDTILRLKDGQIAEISPNAVIVMDSEARVVKPEIQKLNRTSSILDKGFYKHYLLKEIHEQPSVIGRMLDDYSKSKSVHQLLNKTDPTALSRVVLLACGSAYHAALAGKYLIELWARIPVEVSLASEYAANPVLLTDKDLVIGISQSGETADTLAAMRHAAASGAQIAAISNKADSAICDLAKPSVYITPAGIEVSVASTKAFTSQLMSMYLLALSLASLRQSLSVTELELIHSELHQLPQLIEQCIERSEAYKERFIKYSPYKAFLFLSRGVNYPTALEAALKLKELSYIHATGYASGEMKHGPIAILDQDVPVLSIAISGPSAYEQNIYLKTLHNAQEAQARKSPSLLLACDGDTNIPDIFDDIFWIPRINQIYSPLLAIIPLQFLAYFIAEDLGKDVDQPRNLAKSVTVE